jgi:hypothetical protein
VTLAALTWPDAIVISVIAAALGLVFSVATWQIFETGRTDIRQQRPRNDRRSE